MIDLRNKRTQYKLLAPGLLIGAVVNAYGLFFTDQRNDWFSRTTDLVFVILCAGSSAHIALYLLRSWWRNKKKAGA